MFFHELAHVGIYKRSQGRITRQVTFAAIVVTIVMGVLRLSSITMSSNVAAGMVAWFGTKAWLLPFYWLALPCAKVAGWTGFYLWFPSLVLAVGAWATYRLVNVPAFADFLIAVEAEMNKVSWPTRTELYRASAVVLIMIFSLAIMLAAYDYLWAVLLRGVLHVL